MSKRTKLFWTYSMDKNLFLIGSHQSVFLIGCVARSIEIFELKRFSVYVTTYNAYLLKIATRRFIRC